MSKYYACVEDKQGGGFGMGRCYTLAEWIEQAIEWHDGDEFFENKEAENEFRQKLLKDAEEHGDMYVLDYISYMWDIDIQPAEKALAILEADKEKWGSSEDEDETIEAIKKKLGD